MNQGRGGTKTCKEPFSCSNFVCILPILIMLKIYSCCLTLLVLFSCNNHFHQSPAVIKKQKTIIRNYISAEDTRDTVLLKNLLADTITHYWKMQNPNRQKIIDFYKEYWTKNKYSKNAVQSITPVAKNTYSVKTYFEVQRMQADTVIHVESTILYKLNRAGKIVFVGKE